MKSNKLLVANRLLVGAELELVQRGAVLIEGDAIAWAGPAEAAPDADEVIDLGDATILPGLIDAHMHTFGLPSTGLASMDLEREAYRALRAAGELAELLRAGFTTARCLGSSIGPDLARAIREGHVQGPRLLAAGAFISSTGGTWDAGPLPADFPARAGSVADGPDAIRSMVRTRVRQGVDFIKLGLSKGRPRDLNSAWGDDPFGQITTLSLEEVRAATDEAHRQGMLVSAHAIGEEAVVLALDGGVDIIEHGYAITPETRRRLVDLDKPVVTTLSQLSFHLDAAEAFGYPASEREVYQRHWDAMLDAFSKGLREGVRFVLGTDLIGKPTHPLAAAAAEFVLATQNGMEPRRALCAGTSRAAEAIGIAHETGRIEAGMIADICVVPGDPISDITVLQAPLEVVKGGRSILR